MAALTPSSDLDFIINHLVLPPQLPSRDDSQNQNGLKALLYRLRSAAREFRDKVDPTYYNAWSAIVRMLDQFYQLHGLNVLTKDALRRALDDASQSGILVLHISTQNAGIIMRKVNNEYHVEAFEASARAAHVLASKNALVWQFPCRSACIAANKFEDCRFQGQLADFLEKAQLENIKQFAATTLKGGSNAYESRDTTNPAMITELLMALLQAMGREGFPKITQKRIRDDVCWDDGAEIPWRRSPTWLVLRVALQRSLCFLLGGPLGTIHYKFYVAFALQKLCDEICTAPDVPTDRLALLTAKLGRRMAKLQKEREGAPASMQEHFEVLFSAFTQSCQKTLKLSGDVLTSRWNDIRHNTIKRVSQFPNRADPPSMVISLVHSQRYLDRVLEQMYGHFSTPASIRGYSRISLPSSGWTRLSFKAGNYLSDYLDFADFELRVERQLSQMIPSEETLQHDCLELSKYLKNYQWSALPAYRSNPEQLSIMLLTVMELWIALDRATLRLYPLLSEFAVGFPVGLLDVLQLLHLEDMKRLRAVERYLENRHQSTKKQTSFIFQDPSKGCFAEKFYDQSESMQILRNQIDTFGRIAYNAKKLEFEKTNAEYDHLMRLVNENSCVCNELNTDGTRLYCTKCHSYHQAVGLRIGVHEDPLPTDEVMAKAVVFELLCPPVFAAWRDATWSILRDLGRRPQSPDLKPSLLLRDYTQLKRYIAHGPSLVSLASKTKSFLKTHYASLRFPITFDKVCLPNGLRYGLFDHQNSLWCARQLDKPSFADHCSYTLSSKSAFSAIAYALHAVDGVQSKTSNEVVAGQTKCPNSLALTEFNAFQDLRIGVNLQWPRLLRELVLPNLNFGMEEVSSLVTQLALQAGPSANDDVRRAAHWVFKDERFCMTLINQIGQRLDASAPNWRESATVDCLVTLLLRVWSLTQSLFVSEKSGQLLKKARKISLQWARALRNEVLNAKDDQTAHRRSSDAALAALLCRRTFALEAAQGGKDLTKEDLACFLECAIILTENREEDFLKVTLKMRRKLVSDIKLVHRMEESLDLSNNLLQGALEEAIWKIWPEPEGSPLRKWTTWRSLPHPNQHWLVARTIPDNAANSQEVHMNIMEGILFIDGRALGRLPAEYVGHDAFKPLFGDRTFWTFPSSLPGMSHQAASLIDGHQIHFGSRDGVAIIRVRESHTVMELVPAGVFKGPDANGTFDLPRPMIDNCIHWLDLQSNVLKIRQQPDIWKVKHNNWIIDLKRRQARRNNNTLVDTRSRLFHEVGSLIEPFEFRSQILVYQQESGGLTVQLPRLELTFVINQHGFFESRQMRAFIDPNQDCETLYGLESKLVLQATDGFSDRSVLVTLGTPSVYRHASHVRVVVENPVLYCRFSINTMLGRLDCPPEPRLLYLKAYYHAVTSFVCPDPLTMRTGTEEALDCLASASAQPWSPIEPFACEILARIAAITPRRLYYPPNLEVMQRVKMQDQLLAAVQDDRFRPLVQSIMIQSSQLQGFYSDTRNTPIFESGGASHLLERSALRNSMYQRRDFNTIRTASSDVVYETQDRFSTTRFTNVFQSVSSVLRWSRQIPVIQDLSGLLQSWPVFQGFHQNMDVFLLNDLVNLDFPSHWGSLFDYCKQTTRDQDMYKLIFFFAAIAFNTHVDLNVIRTLIAFCIAPEFKTMVGPTWPSYKQFRDGQIPRLDTMMKMMDHSRVPFPRDDHTTHGFKLNPKQGKQFQKDKTDHEKSSLASCTHLAQHMHRQWPCLEPDVSSCTNLPLLDLERAIASIRADWEYCYQNYELSLFISEVQLVLRTCQAEANVPPTVTTKPERECYPSRSVCQIVPSIEELLMSKTLAQVAPAQWDELESLCNYVLPITKAQPRGDCAINEDTAEASELRKLITPFSNDINEVRKRYGVDLENSINAMKRSVPTKISQTKRIDLAQLGSVVRHCTKALYTQSDAIKKGLAQDPLYQWLGGCSLWPNVTLIVLLRTIRQQCNPESVRSKAVVDYALLIKAWQRLRRIETAARQGNDFLLHEELAGFEYIDRQVRVSIDWLLLEIEFDIAIRPAQYQVAKAMIAPSSGSNSVLQMNMGQGKSSVIIPMLAAFLADGKKLVRVIVPKPLLLQMAQVLQARLGGILGRPIKHVPFSRKSSTKAADIEAYFNLHKDCMLNQGVMLCLPEHLLSFKLSGLHSLSNKNGIEAAPMINVQAWFTKKCRDVLDECDHTLAVKTQLIYPFGSQKVVDGHPNRWKVVQVVLSLVKSHLPALCRKFPGGLEVVWRGTESFPAIYIIRQAVKDGLIDAIVQSISNGQGSILPIKDCSREDLDTATSLIRDAKLPKEVVRKGTELFKDRPSAQQDVLLLRGLLVHRILLMALNKRWNVQYGLHPRRDPIAVPYQAKGIPSEQAEFGHPDVAILLTCLSFYYAGLSPGQLQQSLKQLQKADDPSLDYACIIQQSTSVPASLRSWYAINVDDEAHCNDLWKCLRYNMAMVDYFLNHFVFPRHAKTFDKKLVSSGWDIPLYNQCGLHEANGNGIENINPRDGSNATAQTLATKSHISTGFSGTNDNRLLLPLTIQQRDLTELSHTNAEVLTYLLQPRNRRCVLAADKFGKRLSETNLLRELNKRNIRMLIDAGAQILEMDNLALAKAWLVVETRASAAVFFGEDDKARVVYRDHRVVPLAASPFANNLGDCVVYLDESHTRGTDLKMPVEAVGALTLGPGQTKDHTVQAAMRLRQLGTSQAVVFFFPPEVYQSILDVKTLYGTGKSESKFIDSADVITWLIEQTSCNIEQLQPLYISQGLDFCRRSDAAHLYPKAATDKQQRAPYLQQLEQQENYSLERLYGPKKQAIDAVAESYSSLKINSYAEQLQTMKKNLRDTGDTVQGLAHQEVEQEREVAIEVETVREVQRPHHVIAARQRPLSKEVLSFAQTGRLAAGSQSYKQAFAALRQSALGMKLRIKDSAISSQIFVTIDFLTTVDSPLGQSKDEFFRHVVFLLWSTLTKSAMIISPFEAEELLPYVRDAKIPHTHMLTYAAPVSRGMLRFNKLDLYIIPGLPDGWAAPSWLVRELGVFAGRLYFEWDEYPALCQFLGTLAPLPDEGSEEAETKEGHPIENGTTSPLERNGHSEQDLSHIVAMTNQMELREPSIEPFTSRPLVFMQEWLTIRRNGQDFSQTPMGHVCRGRRVDKDSAFFAAVMEAE